MTVLKVAAALLVLALVAGLVLGAILHTVDMGED